MSDFNISWFVKHGVQPKIIFDVGSNDPMDLYRSIEDGFNDVQVHSFEADPDVYAKHNKNLPANIIFNNQAVSNINGTMDFFKSEARYSRDNKWDYSGSLLKPDIEKSKQRHGLYFGGTTSVVSIRLDSYIKDHNIDAIDLLHIDAQGAEKLVVEGLGSLRAIVKMIFAEVDDFDLYDSKITKDGFVEYMIEMGFMPVERLSGDILFINKNHTKEKVQYFFEECIPTGSLVFMPRGGISNRIQNIISAIVYAKEIKRPIFFIWSMSDEVGYGRFEDFLSSEYIFYNLNQRRSELILGSRGYTERVPKDTTSQKIIHHWGYTCREDEDVKTKGYGRLLAGARGGFLKPCRNIQNIVDAYCKANDINQRVGVHMRSFELFYGDRTPQDISNIINNFSNAIRPMADSERFFLCSDCKTVRRTMSESFKSIVYRSENDTGDDFVQRKKLDDTIIGVTDFFILCECKAIIGTKASSFTNMARLMGNKNITWVVGARDCAHFWDG